MVDKTTTALTLALKINHNSSKSVLSQNKDSEKRKKSSWTERDKRERNMNQEKAYTSLTLVKSKEPGPDKGALKKANKTASHKIKWEKRETGNKGEESKGSSLGLVTPYRP